MKIFLYIIVVTFLISPSHFAQEDDRYELSSINFEGNETFDDAELKAAIQSQENPFWFWRFLYSTITILGSPPNYFDSSTISVDIISLKSFYSVNGFFKAEFDYSFVVDTIGKSAEITYFINENTPHTYGNVQFSGLDDLSEEMNNALEEYVNYPSWERYVQENVQKKNDAIITYLKNNGFKLASYDSTVVKIDTLNAKADITTYFKRGRWYTYDDIKIEKDGESSSQVSYELIKYLANINVGDVYREDELSKSRIRLARTGLFSTINLSGEIRDSSSSKVQLLIKGTVGSLNELSPEVFADNEFNFFNVGVGASYTRKNFLGDARKFTIRARFRVNDIANINLDPGLFEESLQTEVDLSAILEQPFLFSRRIAGRLEGYLKSYNISSVDYENFGANFTAAFDMPSYTFVNLFNPYLRFDKLSYSIPALEFEGDTVTVSPSTFTSSLGSELGSTTTDDLFYPTEGRIISLISELSSTNVKWDVKNLQTGQSSLAIDSLGFYYKLQLMVGFYFAVSRDRMTVLGIKAKSGYIGMISGDAILVSPNQTFFAGGSNSVRGWRGRELIPSDQLLNLFPPSLNEQLKIRGGNILLEGSFEYRRKFEEDMGFVFFTDYGNTWNRINDIRIDQIAVAIGTGLRYYSPIAPFRIDFGFKFYDPSDMKFIFDKQFFSTMVIHFGIGEAF
ncbi:MAG: BamA/TamA family outer membrane protein [Ignavibacteriaceae bacterium]|nr:BamA/TamA family outer membrane protein [Ignavibacteriaceae bacterium]